MAAPPGARGTGRSGKFYSELADRLIEHVEQEFELAKRDGDGQTKRESMQALAASAGLPPPEFDESPCPPELAYLLAWWAELTAARQGGFSGANPISYSEIEAWSRLSCVALSHWEVALLRRIDVAFVRSVADGRSSADRNHR